MKQKSQCAHTLECGCLKLKQALVKPMPHLFKMRLFSKNPYWMVSAHLLHAETAIAAPGVTCIYTLMHTLGAEDDGNMKVHISQHVFVSLSSIKLDCQA